MLLCIALKMITLRMATKDKRIFKKENEMPKKFNLKSMES